MAIYVFLIFGHSVHVGSGQPAHDCWLSFVGITRVGHARFGSGPAAPARVTLRLKRVARPVDWWTLRWAVLHHAQDKFSSYSCNFAS